jgi:hypothetical protein
MYSRLQDFLEISQRNRGKNVCIYTALDANMYKSKICQFREKKTLEAGMWRWLVRMRLSAVAECFNQKSNTLQASKNQQSASNEFPLESAKCWNESAKCSETDGEQWRADQEILLLQLFGSFSPVKLRSGTTKRAHWSVRSSSASKQWTIGKPRKRCVLTSLARGDTGRLQIHMGQSYHTDSPWCREDQLPTHRRHGTKRTIWRKLWRVGRGIVGKWWFRLPSDEENPLLFNQLPLRLESTPKEFTTVEIQPGTEMVQHGITCGNAGRVAGAGW